MSKRYSRTFPYLFYYLFALIQRLSDYRLLAYRGDGWSMISTNTEESRQHIKKYKKKLRNET